MINASLISILPKLDQRCLRRSSIRSFLRFLKMRLKFETLGLSGWRTLNHFTTYSDSTFTTNSSRNNTARRVSNRDSVESSSSSSISIFRSLLVTIHTPNNPAHDCSCRLFQALPQQQLVRYCRQAPQMTMMATMANEYSLISQKYPTTAPPNPLKSFSIDLSHQLLKGSFRRYWQQGHRSPDGFGLPGMEESWWRRARVQSGGYLKGLYQTALPEDIDWMLQGGLQ